jgi:hypothetical protein
MTETSGIRNPDLQQTADWIRGSHALHRSLLSPSVRRLDSIRCKLRVHLETADTTQHQNSPSLFKTHTQNYKRTSASSSIMVKKKANKKQTSSAADDDDWEALLEQEASKNQVAAAPAAAVVDSQQPPPAAVSKEPEGVVDAAAAFLASQGLAGDDGEKAAANKKKKKKKPANKAGGDEAPASKKVRLMVMSMAIGLTYATSTIVKLTSSVSIHSIFHDDFPCSHQQLVDWLLNVSASNKKKKNEFENCKRKNRLE